MKVIIPFSYYYPETSAGIYIIDDFMHACAQAGIECKIFVPTPTRNVQAGAKWKKNEIRYNGMIHIHRFLMYGEGKNPVIRALRYFLCECVQLHYCLWKKYDVAFIDSTPPIQGLKLPLIRLFRNKPIVFNEQDIFPDSLAGTGLAKKEGLLWRLGCWVSKVTHANVDKIIVISEDFKHNLLAKGVPENKIVVIHNWVDENAIQPVDKEDNPLYSELNISMEKFHIVYAGNLGNAQNIDILIDAADMLKDNTDIEYLIFGTGGMEEELRTKIASRRLTNIRMFPLQPYVRVSYVYSLGDVCLVSCKAGLGGSAMPSKTWSIMSAGRPILASFDQGSELQKIIEDNQLGVFAQAGDKNALRRAILFLYQNKELCLTYGINGRSFILKNLTRETGTSKYVQVLKSVLADNHVISGCK